MADDSVAFAESVDHILASHLLRDDLQEDLCFALWYPSIGATRRSCLVWEPLLPHEGDRQVHGNASFNSPYYVRAIEGALRQGAGIALIHSHPLGVGPQALSQDDYRAESLLAGGVLSATGLPLVGLTLSGRDRHWSARTWNRKGTGRGLEPRFCEECRVVGDHLRVFRRRGPAPSRRCERSRDRTVATWGHEAQALFKSLSIGIVGLGSVGSIVAEAMARMGAQNLRLFDFDSIRTENLDRTLNATVWDTFLCRSKARVAARATRGHRGRGTARPMVIEYSICEPEGYLQALDCDVLFSCVDRPWARQVMNQIAFAHLIPVIDGGIKVFAPRAGALRGAEWKVHVAAPGHKCLECLRQYDPSDVVLEREGSLDAPGYYEGLSADFGIRDTRNVIAFSLGAGSFEVLQLIKILFLPQEIGYLGGQTYHVSSTLVDLDVSGCNEGCPYKAMVGMGDSAIRPAIGPHEVAAQCRMERRPIRRAMRLFKTSWDGERVV